MGEADPIDVAVPGVEAEGLLQGEIGPGVPAVGDVGDPHLAPGV